LSPDRERLAAPIGTEVVVWNRDGSVSGRCGGHKAQVLVARYLADGRIVSADEAGAVQICDPHTFTSTAFAAARRAVTDIELDPAGTSIVTTGFGEAAVIYKLDGTVERTLAGHTNGIAAGRFSPDGTRVVTVSLDATVRVWDRSTGAIVAILKAPAQLTSVAIDADLVVAGAGDGRLFVWETRTWRLIAALGVRDATVDWVELRDGELLAADTKGRLRRWRLARVGRLDAVAPYVRCHVPYELVDNQPRLRALAADPGCTDDVGAATAALLAR
jgi:WD40 repeat protein